MCSTLRPLFDARAGLTDSSLLAVCAKMSGEWRGRLDGARRNVRCRRSWATSPLAWFAARQHPDPRFAEPASPSVSVRLRPSPSVSVRLRPSPSVSIRLRQSPSVSVRLRPSPSVSVCRRLSPSVSVCLSVFPYHPLLLRGAASWQGCPAVTHAGHLRAILQVHRHVLCYVYISCYCLWLLVFTAGTSTLSADTRSVKGAILADTVRLNARMPRDGVHGWECALVRPVPLLRVWVSKVLTQADSWFLGGGNSHVRRIW